MNRRWPIALLWACSLARLAFYSSMLPIWEGYDEWSHFAVIRATAFGGRLLPARPTPMPRDVEASFEILPLPWEYRSMPFPSVTHDGYWQLPEAERQAREAAFRAMPASWDRERGQSEWAAYETQQPPLYYWLMAPVLWMMRGMGLGDQVMVVRWLGALIGSLAIPLAWLIGRRAFADPRMAAGCAAMVAAMPGFAMNVARVGNDGMAVVWFSALIWLGLEMLEAGPRSRLTIAMGIVLGLGLLSKAYFLTAIPPTVWLLWRVSRGASTRGGRFLAVSVPLFIAAALAGWWYIRNLITSGSFTGLSEFSMPHSGALALMRSAAAVPWARALDSILFSHLYTGGWSWLMVRSWMYHLLYAALAVAAIGVLRQWRRPAIAWMLAVYLTFWSGEIYHVVLIFATRGVATSMGWYLYAVVGAEAALAIGGFAAILPQKMRAWAATTWVLLFALLDLYAMHAVAIPYYTGLVRHKPNGMLATLHPADIRSVGIATVFERLAGFKGALLGEGVLAGLWCAYALGTLGVVIVGRIGLRRAPPYTIGYPDTPK